MNCLFDVAILGGGPAGAAAAISLLQKGYSVAVIEKSDYSVIRIGETLQPGTIAVLNDLKMTGDIFCHHLPANAVLSVWGNTLLKENNFLCNPYGNGWHLDRLIFDKQLIDHAEKSGATVFMRCLIRAIIPSAGSNWNIQCAHDGLVKTMNARFLIDATGRNSLLVKNQGGMRKNLDHLIGLTCILQLASAQKYSNRTLVEAAENGWWYSADIPGNKMAIAYMTDTDLFKKESNNADLFLKHLIGQAKYTKQRSAGSVFQRTVVYAANSYIMTKMHGANWIAIGDAAMAFDPLSSQGIYKAIKSGINAAGFIHEQFTGNKYALENYSCMVRAAFEKYRVQRTLYYEKEQRWPRSLFWKRRSSGICQHV